MNIAIGFGSTETEAETALETAFTEFVTTQYRELGLKYFTDEFAVKVDDWAKQRSKESRDAVKGFATAENPPERYSSFYARTADSASDLVLIVTFHHISRRHAFSPDGWALMQTKRLFHVSCLDIWD